MNRRKFLISIIAATSATKIANASSNKVQLILLRNGGEPKNCNPQKFTSGKLYGVPIGMDLASISSPTGLTFISNVEELPYNLNASNRSSISEGTYNAKVRTDESKPWMKNNYNRAWRLQLEGTSPRSLIQFHYGNDYSWSTGCIILSGDKSSLVCKSGANSSEESVIKLRSYIELNTINSSPEISVRIAYIS